MLKRFGGARGVGLVFWFYFGLVCFLFFFLTEAVSFVTEFRIMLLTLFFRKLPPKPVNEG